MSREMRRAQAKAGKTERSARAPARPIPRPTAAPGGAGSRAGGGGVLSWRPRFLLDIIGELRKVVWPTRQDVWYLTVVVVIVTIIFGAVLGAIDIGFGQLIDRTLLR